MSRFPLPLTRLVHENLSIVMCFAYSQQPLAKLVRTKFLGEWKYLNKALFEISEERAVKACLELALFLRMVDDEEKLSGYFATEHSCGTLFMKDGSTQALGYRDVSNKVIHASDLEWQLSDATDPMLICSTKEKEKWIRAEIDIIAVASVCGQLMS